MSCSATIAPFCPATSGSVTCITGGVVEDGIGGGAVTVTVAGVSVPPHAVRARTGREQR